MFAVASTWRTRYSDMPARSESGPDDERDPPGVAGEVERGLPGRVGAADDEDVAARQGRRLRGGTAVEHAGAVQRLERRDPEPAVAGAHRQEHRRWCGPGHPVGERDDELVAVALEAGRPSA